MLQKLVNIAIPGTAAKYFTYSLPEQLAEKLQPGQRCVVPLGKRNLFGYFLEYSRQKPPKGLRAINDILDRQSLFNGELYPFLLWLSNYYLANPADVFNSALPPQIRQIKRPSYKAGENYMDWRDNQKLPDKITDLLDSKKIISPQNIKTFDLEYPGLLNELIKNDVLKPVWINSAEINDTICIGYQLKSEIKNSEIDDELVKLQSQKSLLQKKEIIDSGITTYRFKKLLESGTLVPVYGLPDLFSYIKPRPEINTIKPNKEQKDAFDTRRETATIKVQDNLFVFIQRFIYPSFHRGGKKHVVSPGMFFFKINQLHQWDFCFFRTTSQFDQIITFRLGVIKRFQRRRRRAEDNRDVGFFSPHDSGIATLKTGGGIILFVGFVMLFIDNYQADIFEWRE